MTEQKLELWPGVAVGRMSVSLRSLYCLLASVFFVGLACAPKSEAPGGPPEPQALPPTAEVVARLTEVGPIGPDDRLGTPSVAEPQLVEVGPRGKGLTYPTITLRFSEAMDASGPRPTVALDPSIQGEFRWTDAYRLIFIPDASFPDARTYTVVVSGSARSRSGVTVPLDARWSFETGRPTVSVSTESYDGDGLEPEPIHWRNRFDVRASHNITAANLRSVTEVFDVTGEKSRPLAFGLQGVFEKRGDRTTRHWQVVPRGHWPADATIEVRLSKGLATSAGPLPTDQAVVRRLRTRKGVDATIDCNDRLPEGCPPGHFTLDFDAPVPRSFLRNVRVSPKPKNLSLSHGYGSDTTMNYVFIGGDFEPGTTYRVRIKKGLKDVHGQPYIGPSVHTVPVVRPPPLLTLSGDAVLLSADKGTLGLESRLVEEASLSISTLEDGALAELLALQHDARYRPRHGVHTQHQTIDLIPGGTYGWDARELDLSKTLGVEHFAAFVEVEPTTLAAEAKGRSAVGSSQMLVQRTDLGAVFGRSPARSFVRVASLRTASPLAGAFVTVFDVTADSPTPATETGTFGPTDQGGFVLLPDHASLPKTAVLVIRRDTDRFAMLVPDSSWYQHGKERGADYDVGVLMPDRNLYRPGEQMRVMGWLAKSVADGGAGLAGPGRRTVKVELESLGKVISETTVRTKAYGKFWATLQVPKDTSLGHAVVRATLGEGASATSFSKPVSVREFEAPAFDVKLSTASADVVHDSSVEVSARATYLHGMPLPIERARLASRCRSGDYEPPGRAKHYALEPTTPPSPWSDTATLVPTAAHKRGIVDTRVDLSPLENGSAYRCTLSLGIQDAARQQISTDTQLWVHPSHYVLISVFDSWDFAKGTAATWTGFSALVDGSTGPAQTAKIEIDALTYDAEGHFVSSKLAKTCTLTMRDATGGRCSWTPPKAGRYRARITATVDGVELARTDSFRALDPPVRRRRSAERIHFTVEAPSHVEPGDAVAVNVLSPDEVSSGFVVDVHAGVRALHPFELRDHHASITLRADDAWVPRTYLDTFVTRPNEDKGPLPRVLRTKNTVDMGTSHRALTVKITNPPTAGIRSTLPIEVRVADTSGQDVENAHVSVWAVDEGVLMLREWQFPDFPSALVTDRGDEATYFEDYGSLQRPYTKRHDPYEPNYGSLGLRGFGRGGGAQIRRAQAKVKGAGGSGSAIARRHFDPAPIFVGDVVTDPAGVARLDGKLPDNLTTFRIAAVATAEVGDTGAFARAGRAEGRVRVTQDLSVRALLPNVLRPGDTAELAALVDNIAGLRGNLDVEVKLDDPTGVLELRTAAKVTRRRTDAPQERVPFTVVARKPGTVRIRVLASLDAKGRAVQDASELSLEVVAERTLQHHSATYGSFDKATPRAIDLAPPAGAHSFTASVDLYTSLLGGYADNVDALVTYPYGCVEQTSSQLVPLIALHALADYPLGIDDTTAFVHAGVQRLADMQLPSGGFAYWPGASTPHVYGTAYAAWVLSLTQHAGYDVAPCVLDRATGFLENELANYGARGTPTLHQEVRAAMALHALAEAERSVPEVREALIARAASLPAFARALLVLAVHREQPNDPRISTLLALVTDNVDERDSIARSRAEPTRYARYFDSPIRTDAMLLLALVQIEPASPLVEKLARGLSPARDEGSIRNTQENAYVLLAMAAYAGLRESTSPALDVHTWLDSDPLLDVRFHGRDLSVHRATTGFDGGGTHRVTLDPQGEGRLYYRVGMGWTKSARDTTAHAAGLAITRRLHGNGGDFGPDRPLPAGDTAWLEVHVTADMRQRYVALDIPIPAGLEAVDTSLGRTGGTLVPSASTKGARGLAYSHKELRRDRILVFVDHLDSGDHRITVPVRATHEGTYGFPPARAEAMYSPEIYGHSDGGTLVVGPAGP